MRAERTPHTDDSLLVQPLVAVTAWTLRAPGTVLAGAIVLALLSVAVTVNSLTFKTDRLDLLNPRSEYNQRWLAYLAEFGNRDDAVIVVRAAGTVLPGAPLFDARREMTAAIDDLASQLRAEPQHFDSVFHRRDLSTLKTKALHYLPPAELAKVETQLAAAAAVLPSSGEPANPLAHLESLNEQLARISTANPQQRSAIETQYTRAATTLLACLTGSTPSAASSATFDLRSSIFDPQYLLADEGRLGFVLTKFTAEASAAPAIARLRAIITATRTKHPGLSIGLTGMPVIEHDEMQASQFDMLWTSLLSMGLVLLLYLASYGGLRHALLVNVLLLLATAYSFGFVTLAVGHLNILSAAFSAVLIGLGIDFSIHYIASYLALRKQGCDEVTALMRMAAEVGPGMVTGGVTTAAAFFMAAMTDFLGVRELGLVAGGGILLCVLSAVVILPPLVLLVDQRWPLVTVPTILPAGRWLQFPLRCPRLVIGASLLVTLLLAAGVTRLRYDHNLLNLQPRHLESADLERELFTSAGDSVWYAVSICSTRQELRERLTRFHELPVVAKTEEIAALLPDHSPEDSQRLRKVFECLARLPETASALTDFDAPRLQRTLTTSINLLSRETPYETPTTTLLTKLQAALTALPSAEAGQRLSQGQAALWKQAAAGVSALRSLSDPVPPRLSDLPRELTDRFIGKNQTYLLKVYARGNIWNMREMEAFVRAVESVDPRVTGHPVQTFYASRHMQQSYLWAGLYALLAVLALLWIDLRSLSHALLAMVPLAFGFIQMCGLIGWLDLPLNPANMIVLPLILGIGVDHGVHLVHLWRQQRGRFSLSDSTAVAVLLTATTTTASFGALILARHQGLQSLGQVLTLGVTTCLASSIIFFPALLTSLAPRTTGLLTSTKRAIDPAPVETSALQPPTLNLDLGTLNSPATPAPPSLQTLNPEPRTLNPFPAPAPVTDEEIAALLESALAPRILRVADTYDDSDPDTAPDDATTPRRRNLPRRTDAA